MFKLLSSLSLILSIALLSQSSYAAEWQRAVKSSENNDTYYIDMSTLKRNGDIAEVTILSNYENEETIENIKFLSSVEDITFNCKNNSYTRHNISFYELNNLMGKKKISLTQPGLAKNKKVDNFGVGDGLLKFSCDSAYRKKIIDYYAKK